MASVFYRSDEILALKIDDEVGTLRDFLRGCLLNLWMEGESFSGKRPLGNSDWDTAIYKALVRENYVKGSINEYDGLEICAHELSTANALILDAIDELCREPSKI